MKAKPLLSSNRADRAPRKFHLKIPSHSENLEIIREFVGKVAQKVGFGEEDIYKIELAVDEACTNVIRHAYDPNHRRQDIDIDIAVSRRKMTIVVIDYGKGFDPAAIPHPNMEEYLSHYRVGGLGIFLMETLMDEVDFDIQPGVRNRVKLVKYIGRDESDGNGKQARERSSGFPGEQGRGGKAR